MAQILLEFGSEGGRAVRAAVEIAVSDVAFTTDVLPTEGTHELEYQPSIVDLHTAFAELETGKLSSVRLRTESGAIAWVLVYGPTFGSDRAAAWTGVAEFRERVYRPTFDRLRTISGLSYVVVSWQETLDLEPSHARVDSFPWDHWLLVLGAVSDRTSGTTRWVVRPGPAAAEVNKL